MSALILSDLITKVVSQQSKMRWFSETKVYPWDQTKLDKIVAIGELPRPHGENGIVEPTTSDHAKNIFDDILFKYYWKIVGVRRGGGGPKGRGRHY